MLVWQWSKGRADAGDIAFAITSFMLMTGYLRNVGDNIRMAQRGLDDSEDVARYATMAPQVVDAPGAPAFRSELGEIVFDRVVFRYKSAGQPLYDNFTLRIAPGERVALVGPTGAGKSTFVKLIQRLYDVESGQILIDGQDIAPVNQGSLRRAIAVVPQDPALFHRSLAENIAYARPGATDDEIALAPSGRAPTTSSPGCRRAIDAGRRARREALGRRAAAGGDRPRLPGRRADPGAGRGDLVAGRGDRAPGAGGDGGADGGPHHHRHRPPLSTIRGADRILVFEDGRIVEEGKHTELVKKGGAYARLHAVTEGWD
jgi:ATP-binding cassette subfamily B protein